MALTDTLRRCASGFAALLRMRLEIAALELEIELAYFSSFVVWALVALFCGAIAILLGILGILIIFWESHRELALWSMTLLFALLSLGIAFFLRYQMQHKPRLLAATLKELREDIASLSGESRRDTHKPRAPYDEC